MRVKFSILTLLIVGLVFGFAVQSHAALTFEASDAYAANAVAAGDSFVVAKLMVSNSDIDDKLGAIGFTGGSTGTIAAGDIANISLYQDVNNDGAVTSADTYLGQLASGDFGAFLGVGTPQEVNITDVTYTTTGGAGVKYFLMLVAVKTTASDDNSTITVTAMNVKDDSGVAGAVGDANGDTVLNGANDLGVSHTLEIVATHLKWAFDADVYGSTVAIKPGVNGTTILSAVDDYGNLDVDFAEDVIISAVDYADVTDVLTADLVATTGAGANAATSDITVTTVANRLNFSAGTILWDTTPNAVNDEIQALSFDIAGSLNTGNVGLTLVATSTTKNLTGSQTVVVGNANAFTSVAIQSNRGVELYDTNHNGKLDTATMMFASPMTVGATLSSQFSVAGYTVASTAPAISEQNGGPGIYNAGPFGVTIKIVEGDETDTGSRPQVTFSSGTLANRAGTAVSSVGTAQAVEVDKARPVLMSVKTQDTGIGTGIASNGIIDGIKFEFSEVINNVHVSSTDTSATASLIVDISTQQSISFNQGNGTISGKELTIPVGETIIDTGITPLLFYKQYSSAYLIKDSATTAVGAMNPNNFYPKKTDFGDQVTFTVADGAPIVVHSVETHDNNSNGKIDRFNVTFSEPPTDDSGSGAGVEFISSVSAFGSLNNGVYIVTSSALTVAGGKEMVFNVTETPGKFDTEATPIFQYNPSAPNAAIHDDVGVELGLYGPGGLPSPATIDKALPIAVAVITRDAYSDTTYAGGNILVEDVPNGRVDTIEVVFSEQVKTNKQPVNGGTALDTAVGQFSIVHSLVAGPRTLFQTTNEFGKPEWTDANANGDTKTTIKFSFHEIAMDTVGMVNHGDTGVTAHTIKYAKSGSADHFIKDMADVPNLMANEAVGFTVLDGAPPFLVDGIGKGWHANAFANVITVDSDSVAMGGAGDDTANGNGYIDGFKLQFTEPVWFLDDGVVAVDGAVIDSLEVFSVELPGDGELTFKNGSVDNNGTNTVTLQGRPNYKGSPDTDAVPVLNFTGELVVRDATWNRLSGFEEKQTYDGAVPVITAINTGEALDTLLFTFSEPLTSHDSDGKNISIEAADILAAVIFGYENNAAGGARSFSTTYVTNPAPNQILAKVNSDITVEDIEQDRYWIKSNKIWDDANAEESGLADNVAKNSSSSAGIKINNMDDVVAPWIILAETMDIDANGYVDHIKFQLSENIDDSTIKGYVDANTMSEDVSATWIISGYTGEAHWNFFNDNAAGHGAAALAEKYVFGGNMADDDVLYLELDESGFAPYAVSGMGTTGVLPTVTWGTEANAVTLGDFRPNVLDTASTETSPKAVNGTVSDKAKPVIVAATYSAPAAKAAKETGGKITAYWSEEIKDISKKIINTDIYFSGNANNTDKYYLWGYNWAANGVLEFDVKSDWSFPVNAKSSIQLLANAANFKDVKDNVPLIRAAATDTDAQWYKAVSPMSNDGATSVAKTLGDVTITGLTFIDFTKFVPATLTVGEPVEILWTQAGVENLELYISYNGGVDWELVEGSATAAADGVMLWTPRINVNAIKLQSVEDDTIKDTTSSGLPAVKDFNVNPENPGIGAPADLAIVDVPNDNGGFVVAQFTVSADHLTGVNSYQFYREMALNDADPNDMTMVLWAAVEAGTVDDMNKQSVVVPTIWNGDAKWEVRASTGSVISGATAAAEKAADASVATIVYGAAEKAASTVISSESNVVVGGSIDNIAPSAVTDFAVNTADAGVEVSWLAADDHGVVSSFVFRGAVQNIYGVEAYNVYRSVKGEDSFELVGTAGPGSSSFIDEVEKGSAVYQYYLVAADSNPEHDAMSVTRSGISTTSLQGDLDGDAIIGASDFSIFAANYGAVAAGNEADYVWAYDLNADGKIDAADFSIFAAAYGSSMEAAKAAVADMPTSNIPVAMSSMIDDATSTYFVNVTIGSDEAVNGFEFFMNYNTDAFEFMPNSVNGLTDLNIVREVEDGIIQISNWSTVTDFSGTVSLGFRATGINSTSSFELINPMVDGADGLARAADVELEARALPTVYSLSQNYPNPFNPTTTIDYALPKTGTVDLVIYNTSGQKVRTLVSNVQEAGFYKMVWDGRNEIGEQVASGVYIYRLVAGSFSKTVKMNLIK